MKVNGIYAKSATKYQKNSYITIYQAVHCGIFAPKKKTSSFNDQDT